VACFTGFFEWLGHGGGGRCGRGTGAFATAAAARAFATAAAARAFTTTAAARAFATTAAARAFATAAAARALATAAAAGLLLARSVGSDLDASTLGQAFVRVRFAVLAAHWPHDFNAHTCLTRGDQCHVAPRSDFRTFRTRTIAVTTCWPAGLEALLIRSMRAVATT